MRFYSILLAAICLIALYTSIVYAADPITITVTPFATGQTAALNIQNIPEATLGKDIQITFNLYGVIYSSWVQIYTEQICDDKTTESPIDSHRFSNTLQHIDKFNTIKLSNTNKGVCNNALWNVTVIFSVENVTGPMSLRQMQIVGTLSFWNLSDSLEIFDVIPFAREAKVNLIEYVDKDVKYHQNRVAFYLGDVTMNNIDRVDLSLFPTHDSQDYFAKFTHNGTDDIKCDLYIDGLETMALPVQLLNDGRTVSLTIKDSTKVWKPHVDHQIFCDRSLTLDYVTDSKTVLYGYMAYSNNELKSFNTVYKLAPLVEHMTLWIVLAVAAAIVVILVISCLIKVCCCVSKKDSDEEHLAYKQRLLGAGPGANTSVQLR